MNEARAGNHDAVALPNTRIGVAHLAAVDHHVSAEVQVAGGLSVVLELEVLEGEAVDKADPQHVLRAGAVERDALNTNVATKLAVEGDQLRPDVVVPPGRSTHDRHAFRPANTVQVDDL